MKKQKILLFTPEKVLKISSLTRNSRKADRQSTGTRFLERMLLNVLSSEQKSRRRRGVRTTLGIIHRSWQTSPRVGAIFCRFRGQEQDGEQRGSYERKRCRNCGFLLVARWRKERARNPDRASGEDEVLWPKQTRNSQFFLATFEIISPRIL